MLLRVYTNFTHVHRTQNLNFHIREVNTRNRVGYTMAADLWSVGTLTTALFGGQSYFTIEACKKSADPSEEEVRRQAALCNLTAMTSDWAWRSMSPLAIDFIQKLLVSKEQQRMLIKDALKHGWFTSDSAKDMRESYKAMTLQWQPSAVAEDFEEDIKTYVRNKRLQEEVNGPQTLYVSTNYLLVLDGASFTDRCDEHGRAPQFRYGKSKDSVYQKPLFQTKLESHSF